MYPRMIINPLFDISILPLRIYVCWELIYYNTCNDNIKQIFKGFFYVIQENVLLYDGHHHDIINKPLCVLRNGEDTA